MTANRHYLVRYGRPGYIGRFVGDSDLARGARVVVRGPRGVELGDVLSALEAGKDKEDGDLLRRVTSHDEAEWNGLEALGQAVLAAATAGASRLPLAFVDVELTFDATAILHTLVWDECDATPLLDELGARFGYTMRLLDLSRAPVAREDNGCGKPGCGAESGGCSSCGTEGGGCSSGSCSRGAVKSAEELTSYFSALRHQMEEAGLVRTPLN